MIKFGIQGGKGSFNEEAARYYLERAGHGIGEDVKVNYLYTSEGVLSALESGDIDLGQCAIHNSTGGVVMETIRAMGAHKFQVKDTFSIVISHALMCKPNISLGEIETIMTHPQVLAQCKKTLSEKYPNLVQKSGEGEMVDHARVAESLGNDELPDSVAVMGSSILATIHKLKIIEENLQDMEKNFTSFLVVKPSEVSKSEEL